MVGTEISRLWGSAAEALDARDEGAGHAQAVVEDGDVGGRAGLEGPSIPTAARRSPGAALTNVGWYAVTPVAASARPA